MRLAGQVAIITGAGRGIGKAIALAFAREGARLALASRTAAELEETADEARRLGAEALVVPTDVADREQADRMAARALEHYGAIDVLVNNAGSAGPLGMLHEADPDRWVNTIQVNLFGTYYCSRAALPIMLRQGRGRIVNICAGGGISPYPLFSAYVAGKVGIMKVAEVMALELAGTNIRVNCVCPGGVATRMLEGNRDDAGGGGTHRAAGLHQRRAGRQGGVPRPDGGANGVPGQRRVRGPHRPGVHLQGRPRGPCQARPGDYGLRRLLVAAGGAGVGC